MGDTYTNLILNGIRSVEPINMGPLKRFKVLLKCNYGTCKRYLHRIFTNLLTSGEPVTYELTEHSRERCLAQIYVENTNVVNEIKRELARILDKAPISAGYRYPSYSAVEVFFDLLVNAAFKKSSFGYVRGKRKVLDLVDFSKCVRKRTVIELKSDDFGNENYYGILFIDYSRISRSFIADKLLEELGIDDFAELKYSSKLRERCSIKASSYMGKTILTIIKRGGRYEYVYGKITGIEPVFSYEKVLPNGQTIYELWIGRFREDEDVKYFVETEPSKWEFPLFKVKLEGYADELYYPPSMLRVFEDEKRPDPSTRWDNVRRIMRVVEDNIKKTYKNVTGNDIRFRYIKYTIDSENVGIKPNFYTGSDLEKPFREYTIKLKYRDEKGMEEYSHASPIYVFSRGLIPYAGKQKLKLLVIYPSTVNEVKLKEFVDHLTSLFEELNLGNICDRHYYVYKYISTNLSESLTSLENILQKVLSSCNRSEYLPLIIIPDSEDFFKLSKEIASSNGFHSQIVNLETFSIITEKLTKIGNRYPSYGTKQKLMETVRLSLANICGGIYVEFLIQKSIAEDKISGPLTWALASPADGDGRSMYVGLDISTKRGVSGAAFILLDPYGELIDARIIQLKSEVLKCQDYYDVLRYMISKARDKGLSRIAILRDGVPRSPLEFNDCLNAFNKVTKELKYKVSLDYMAVIKKTCVRVFASDRGVKVNPIQGMYVYAYRLKHFDHYAHEVFVAASKPEESGEGGTTRPIILRIYELQRSYSINEIKRFAEEYLALTRLNYWNLRTGASRLALPVKMADKLSYMLSMGIPIKVR